MSLQVYGIKNCNTMKKTFDHLESEGVSYVFWDYKKKKPTVDLLKSFLEKCSLEELINKKGMTYRKMDENQRKDLESVDSALPILVEHSSMIKRPIVVFPEGTITLGFVPKKWDTKG